MSKSVVIIPSRLDAKRLPNKPLLKINNIPLIIHVMERAKESGIGDVIVATPDQKIFDYLYAESIPYGRGGIASMAISAIDLALWDAYSKYYKVPIKKLLEKKEKRKKNEKRRIKKKPRKLKKKLLKSTKKRNLKIKEKLKKRSQKKN